MLDEDAGDADVSDTSSDSRLEEFSTSSRLGRLHDRSSEEQRVSQTGFEKFG
jgi:hypothetical protein